MNATTPCHTFLDRLPTELLQTIKFNIDDDDLVSHVHFYNLNDRIGALYDHAFDDPNSVFWYTICRHIGLGCLPDDIHELGDVDWKDIAFKCVAHADVCTHPGCGVARLRENGARYVLWTSTKHLSQAFSRGNVCRIGT